MKHNTSIKTKEVYAKYELEGHNHKLKVKISKGKITMKPNNNYDTFEFMQSNPKTIQAIAELMLEAVYIHNDAFGE